VRGDAVMWYNMKADGMMRGMIDQASLHGGCDPAPGEVTLSNLAHILNQLLLRINRNSPMELVTLVRFMCLMKVSNGKKKNRNLE
jgi:hypothetical protein